MATLFSIGTGNFTTAGTWGVVDATMFNASETTTTALTTSFVGATTYTPGAITITHIGVKLSVRTGTTGTMSVRLAQGGVAVAGTTVTINVADLPVAATADLNGGWIFFKLSASKLLTAATAYSVQATTSNASQVSLRSTATSNWAVALVTTTTAAPAAADNLIIGGEYISAGSSNSFTVTMDNTATTDFGSAPTAANSLLTPGIAIGSKGTLTWGTAAATAYYMRMSNSIIVYTGGTLNMGTSGTPCPRDSTMTLFFDVSITGDYRLLIRNLGTFNAYGQSRTSGKDIFYCKLTADQSANSFTLTVDTDTGWLDNDLIGVGGTRFNSTGDTVNVSLNGNATATTLTVDGGTGTGGSIAAARSGTSPTQAEVVLLTRNVKIIGQTGGANAVLQFQATSIVTLRWVEFQYLGANSGGAEGIIVNTTTGTFDCQYCSAHTTVGTFFYVGSTNATSITISNNVCRSASVYVLYVISGTSTVTYNTNVSLLNNTGKIEINSPNVTMTNNILTTGTSTAGAIVFNSTPIFSGGVIHGNGGCGIEIGSTCVTGSIVSASVWRNIAGNTFSGGIFVTYPTVLNRKVYVGKCDFFGNGTANIGTNTSYYGMLFDNITSNGDTSSATTNGCYLPSGVQRFTIINSNFSSASGIKTAHTSDFSYVSTAAIPQIICQNTQFNGTTTIPSIKNFHPISYISSQKHGQIANSHVLYKPYGTIRIASGTVHSGSTSLQLQPTSASNKLESSGIYGGFKVPISSGQYCSPTVYVYEDGSYNGNRARLIVKRNGALGIDETILMTATAGSDLAWQGLSGSTPVVNDTGVLEFIVDCDGTAGNLYVDTFSATLT